MRIDLPDETIFCFFRLGLVTGLVERQTVITWADRQILERAVPNETIIELSLASGKPYSQIIWMLNHMQGAVDYNLATEYNPLKMLFACAEQLLAEDPNRAKQIAQGLSLLLAEEYLPKEIRNQLYSLEGNLEAYQIGLINPEDFKNHLIDFLRSYTNYRHLLAGIIN